MPVDGDLHQVILTLSSGEVACLSAVLVESTSTLSPAEFYIRTGCSAVRSHSRGPVAGLRTSHTGRRGKRREPAQATLATASYRRTVSARVRARIADSDT